MTEPIKRARGRPSKFLAYKPAILDKFKEGKTPSDIFMNFPSVPFATITSWHKAYLLENESKSSNKKNNLTVLVPNKQETDFHLIKRTLRRIILDPDIDPKVSNTQISASKILLDTIKIEATIPKHILEEMKETEKEIAQKKLEDMSVEELTKRYKELLQNPGS